MTLTTNERTVLTELVEHFESPRARASFTPADIVSATQFDAAEVDRISGRLLEWGLITGIESFGVAVSRYNGVTAAGYAALRVG